MARDRSKGRKRPTRPKAPTKPQPQAKQGSEDPAYRVLWHPNAEKDREKVKDPGELTAMQNAREKLEGLGPDLPFPHQSGVKGKHGKGLRELRPRGGSSPWRPLYARVKADTFVILAVGPEAQGDQAGFDRAAKRAQQRLANLEVD